MIYSRMKEKPIHTEKHAPDYNFRLFVDSVMNTIYADISAQFLQAGTTKNKFYFRVFRTWFELLGAICYNNFISLVRYYLPLSW